MDKDDIIDNAKKKIKRKYPVLYVILLVAIFVIGVYWGDFKGKSTIIEETNPLTKLFGIKRVDFNMDENPIIGEKGNYIPTIIKNTGDKNIESLDIYYEVGGHELKRATDFGFDKLDVDEEQNFKIQIFDETMNASCSEIAEFTLDTYIDEKGLCYFEEKNYAIDVCLHHRISLLAYSRGKLIGNHTEWYPYFQGPLLINTSLASPKSCVGITDEKMKEKLKPSQVRVAMIDVSTYCNKGNDPQWCLNLRN